MPDHRIFSALKPNADLSSFQRPLFSRKFGLQPDILNKDEEPGTPRSQQKRAIISIIDIRVRASERKHEHQALRRHVSDNHSSKLLSEARFELEAATANLACEQCRFPERKQDLAYAEKRAERAIAAFAAAEQMARGSSGAENRSSVPALGIGRSPVAPCKDLSSRLPFALGAALTCGFIVGGLL